MNNQNKVRRDWRSTLHLQYLLLHLSIQREQGNYPMRQKWLLRLLALVSFLTLMFTFLWCNVDNILTSAEMAKAGAVMPVTSMTVLTALLWLIGHGIHGVAAIAIPVFILHMRAKNEVGYVYVY